MISILFSWLAGGGITAIGKQLNRAHENKLNAKNSSERIEADKAISQLESRRAVLVAEQKGLLTRWIRPAFALPFVIYDFKIVVWDKVLG
ncbi:MAG: hypothetical protein ACR2OJ_14515 [Hyphomicrobiales bacterium]